MSNPEIKRRAALCEGRFDLFVMGLLIIGGHNR